MKNAVCICVIALFSHPSVVTTSVAGEVDAQSALAETVSMARACQREFGSKWDPIVEDGLMNLQAHVEDEDPTVPKVDLDVILTEALAAGDGIPASDELRQYCANVMASGS